jgi:hypothetical protein
VIDRTQYLDEWLVKIYVFKSELHSARHKSSAVSETDESESGPGFPSRKRFPQSMGSVTRVLRSAVVFLLQVAVVAGIRKVIDLLFP